MKKILTIISVLCVLVAVPAFAIESTTLDDTTTKPKSRAAYSDDLSGIRQRIEDLKQEREELKEQRRAELATSAKKVTAKYVDNIIKKYETIKNRVSKMTVLSETQKTDFTTRINAEIEKLKTLKTELAAATEAAEVKVVVDKIKEQAKLSKAIVKEIVLAVHLNHYTNLHSRLSKVYETLSEKVTASTSSDKTTLETSLAAVKTDLDSAKTAIDAKNVSDAKKYLQDARLKMVKLVKDLKQASKTTNAETETESTNEATD